MCHIIQIRKYSSYLQQTLLDDIRKIVKHIHYECRYDEIRIYSGKLFIYIYINATCTIIAVFFNAYFRKLLKAYTSEGQMKNKPLWNIYFECHICISIENSDIFMFVWMINRFLILRSAKCLWEEINYLLVPVFKLINAFSSVLNIEVVTKYT